MELKIEILQRCLSTLQKYKNWNSARLLFAGNSVNKNGKSKETPDSSTTNNIVKFLQTLAPEVLYPRRFSVSFLGHPR